MKNRKKLVVPEFASGATEEQVDEFQRNRNANGYYGGAKFDLKGGKPRQQNRNPNYKGNVVDVTIINGLWLPMRVNTNLVTGMVIEPFGSGTVRSDIAWMQLFSEQDATIEMVITNSNHDRVLWGQQVETGEGKSTPTPVPTTIGEYDTIHLQAMQR